MFAILIWMLCIIFQSMSASDRFSSQYWWGWSNKRSAIIISNRFSLKCNLLI